MTENISLSMTITSNRMTLLISVSTTVPLCSSLEKRKVNTLTPYMYVTSTQTQVGREKKSTLPAPGRASAGASTTMLPKVTAQPQRTGATSSRACAKPARTRASAHLTMYVFLVKIKIRHPGAAGDLTCDYMCCDFEGGASESWHSSTTLLSHLP
jgi:hypothetical protein